MPELRHQVGLTTGGGAVVSERRATTAPSPLQWPRRLLEVDADVRTTHQQGPSDSRPDPQLSAIGLFKFARSGARKTEGRGVDRLQLEQQDCEDAPERSASRYLIAGCAAMTSANLTAFDVAFYPALLSQVRRETSTVDRVVESLDSADRH